MEVTLVPPLLRSDLLNLSSLSGGRASELLIQELGGFSPLHVTLETIQNFDDFNLCNYTCIVSEKKPPYVTKVPIISL